MATDNSGCRRASWAHEDSPSRRAACQAAGLGSTFGLPAVAGGMEQTKSTPLSSASSRLARPAFHSRSAPLLPLAAALVVGVVLDAQVEAPPIWAIATFALASAAALLVRLRGASASPALLPAAVALGALLHFNAVRRVPADDIERHVPEGGTLLRVRGVVADDPRVLDDREYVFAP